MFLASTVNHVKPSFSHRNFSSIKWLNEIMSSKDVLIKISIFMLVNINIHAV